MSTYCQRRAPMSRSNPTAAKAHVYVAIRFGSDAATLGLTLEPGGPVR